MAHPALVAVFIGLGVAALLYYMFIDEEEGEQQRAHTNNDDSGGSRNNYNNIGWNSEQSSNNRRRRSSTLNLVNSDDCSICLSHLSGYTMVRLQPCRHFFHKKCIDDWQILSSGDGSCPLCRETIQEKIQIRI